MVQGNSTCPEPEKEWAPWFRSFSLTMFVFLTIYFVGTIAWWWSRRKHPILQKRNFHLMTVAAMGGYFEFILVCLGPYLGRSALPCDLFLWLVFFVVPLAAGPLAVRLVLFRNNSLYSRALLRERQNSESFWDRFQGQGVARVLPASLQQKLASSPPQPSAPGSSETVETSENSAKKTMRRLFLLTTRRFASLVLSLYVLVALVSIASKYGPSTPFGKGCYGCHISNRDLAQFSAETILVAFVGFYMLWKVRNEADPLGIVFELKICMLCVVMAVSSVVVTTLDPLGLKEEGTFDWLTLLTFWIFVYHTVQCTVPVLKTYEMFNFEGGMRRRTSFKELTLQDILASPSGRTAFEKYLATEFSVENLYFVDTVKKFKASFSEAKPDEREAMADEILNTFLKVNSMLEVNVSSHVRQQIRVKFATSILKPDVFDSATEEITQLMSNDSFPRFLRSTLFQEWVQSELTVSTNFSVADDV